MKEIMEKNCVAGNESNEIDTASVWSMIVFAVSIIMWYLTLKGISEDVELCSAIHHVRGGLLAQCWGTVSLLWGVSLWLKLWIITAVASTAICWCAGGFFSLIASIGSFFMPIFIGENLFILVGLSISVWLFIIGLNVVVFILWCIFYSLKYDKEVSPER